MAQSKRYRELNRQARRRLLNIAGGFHPAEGEDFPAGTKTVLLLGPHEPAFWPQFEREPEYWDGQADPLDRWSKRVIDRWAERLDAEAFYPFGGPPHHPFFTWALRTGRCHSSPVNLLVHDEAGLWISFRGALALKEHVELPPTPPNPCETCEEKPCLSACPVSALTSEVYDVDRCARFLRDDPEPLNCMNGGCNVRRTCPVSLMFGRRKEQSKYHMQIFLENR
jgi:ferredoxin